MSVYLDNNATTALDERVLEAMLPYMGGYYGNASSLHRYGRTMRSAIDHAREQVAALVNAHPSQVIFTSNGSETNNWVMSAVPKPHKRVAISAIEHPSLLEPAQQMQQDGCELILLDVTADGVLDLQALNQYQSLPLDLCSVMLANNETGAIQPLSELRQWLEQYQPSVILHTDATQAAGKVDIEFDALGVQFMTLSSHKLYGPLGAGALITDKTVQLKPLVAGGGQERGLRAGTENIPAIVGFGMAAELAIQEFEQRKQHSQRLVTRLASGLSAYSQVVTFAENAQRLPNTVQFGLKGFHGEATLMKLDCKDIAVSSGSACHAEKSDPSHVLIAMGVDEETALTAIRASVGKNNTEQDVDRLLNAIDEILNSSLQSAKFASVMNA